MTSYARLTEAFNNDEYNSCKYSKSSSVLNPSDSIIIIAIMIIQPIILLKMIKMTNISIIKLVIKLNYHTHMNQI